jgi:hypothetical protein
MNHKMKKTALILAFLACLINSQGFAGSKKELDAVKEDIKRIDGDITSISGKLDLLNGKIPDPGNVIPEPGPEDAPSDPAAGGKIPVTAGIVDYFLNSNGKYEGLKFYLSKPFALKIQNDIAEIEVKDNMVMLNSPIPDREIKFTENSEGVLNEISPSEKGGEIKILFQEEGKTLVFIRKPGGYELSSAVLNDRRTQEIQLPEPIQLLVSGKDNRQAEVKAASADFEYPAPKPQVQNYQPYHNINAGYSAERYIPAIPSRSIIDSGSLSPEGVIKFAGERKHSALSKNDVAIIHEYFKEAVIEGVNVDIAIAQMLYVTDFFRNKQRLASFNYAGLSPRPQRKFNGSFNSMTEGVRAHIQHLKAYAKEPLKQSKVDPRYDLAYKLGYRGMRLEQLYGHWAQNQQYGQKIDNILCDLYQYSDA